MILKTYYSDKGLVEIPCQEVKRVKLGKAIKSHAGYDIHRLNAKTADCYAFGYYTDSKGKIDFEGGWDWINYLVDKGAEYILELSTGKFYKINWN